MSDVMNCPTCGAVCRILGQDAEGLPQPRAFQNTDAQKKIEQLKKSLHHIEGNSSHAHGLLQKQRFDRREAELPNLRKSIGVD